MYLVFWILDTQRTWIYSFKKLLN